MKRRILWYGMICGVLCLTACGPQPSQTLPTLVPTLGATETPPETIEPTATPFQRATLPPTWTPLPAGEAATAVPTLPPLLPTPTFPQALPTLVACGSFVEDRAQTMSEFVVGTAPLVAWTPVQDAAHYRVYLIDEFGFELLVDFTVDTTYTFSADLFVAGERYGWEVYPVDVLGAQMCLKRGGELLPRAR